MINLDFGFIGTPGVSHWTNEQRTTKVDFVSLGERKIGGTKPAPISPFCSFQFANFFGKIGKVQSEIAKYFALCKFLLKKIAK